MTFRIEQKQKRKEQILEAALDQFIRRGYGATKIQDIADKANMSVGLLFHYFESKEALYLELIQRGASAPKDMIKGFEQAKPLVFFELCASSILTYAASSPFFAKMFVLMSNAYCNEGIPEEARKIALAANVYEGVVPLIEKGQEEGSIRQGNPLALSTAFWTAIQGSMEAYAFNPELPLPEAEWFVDIIRKKKESTK